MTSSSVISNSTSLEHLSDEILIAELNRRFPDRVLVPRIASHIMALRGTQESSVFKQEENVDVVTDYLDLTEVGEIDGYVSLANSIDVDERTWLIAAAVWRGCIKGLEEWSRKEALEGKTHMVESWKRPCLLKNKP